MQVHLHGDGVHAHAQHTAPLGVVPTHHALCRGACNPRIEEGACGGRCTVRGVRRPIGAARIPAL
jgi:hypothetical protein